MSLLRAIRRPAPQPTQPMLKRLLDKYGLRRRSAAKFMYVSEVQFSRYCLPALSKQHCKIPLVRWQMLLIRVKEMRHPQEDVEL